MHWKPRASSDYLYRPWYTRQSIQNILMQCVPKISSIQKYINQCLLMTLFERFLSLSFSQSFSVQNAEILLVMVSSASCRILYGGSAGSCLLHCHASVYGIATSCCSLLMSMYVLLIRLFMLEWYSQKIVLGDAVIACILN